MSGPRLYGIAAEFDGPEPLVEAARALHERGFRKMEAYTPYPLKQLEGIIEGSHKLPLLVLIGGICGAATAWTLQYYVAAIEYPINIGGRPLNSWPSFIVILFELTILCAAVTAFVGTLALSGLPLPHHPMFNVPTFGQASSSRFFLCVEARDPLFDAVAITRLLSPLNPLEIHDVEED